MDNNRKLFEGLLKADGIDPAGATESERIAFEKMLNEQSKSKQSKPGSQPDIWRIIMKSRITKFAAVAVIIIAVILGLNIIGGPDIASVAWANAVGPILNARTVSFDAALKFGDQPEQESHFDCLIPDRFKQTMSDGTINIVDYGQQKVLVLDTNKQSAEIGNLKDKSSEISLYNIFIEMQNLIKQTIDMDNDSVARLGHGNINGQKAIGFQVQLIGSGIIPGWYGKGDFIVWTQPETNLALQLEWHSHMTGLVITVNNLVIDEVIDESIFSLEKPENYELKFFEGQIEIPKELLSTPVSDEQKIINFLWSWTILSKGLFPSSLSTDAIKDIDPNATISFKQKGWGFKSAVSINLSSLFDRFFDLGIDRELTEEEIEQLKQKQGPVYERLQGELEKRMEEIKPLMTAIGNGFSVVFQMPANSDWHYAGKNVEFGDADTAIFWYRPKGSEMYRVIHGDLSAGNFSVEELAELEAALPK
ncbi:MAG: hypothetical protein ACYS1A_06660 [Planctomycetota bacterium]|jgi:hypothetical protein